MDDKIIPWERNSGETDNQFIMFKRYLMLPQSDRRVVEAYRQELVESLVMGGMSQDEAWEKARKKSQAPAMWLRASTQFNWAQRAKSYDLYQINKLFEKREQDIEQTRNRHRKLALLTQNIAYEKLKALDNLKADADVSTDQALRYLIEGTKLELQSLVLPEQHIKVSGVDGTATASPIDYNDISQEDIEKIYELAKKINEPKKQD